MKKLDKNLKIGIIALAVFVVFLIAFSVLSSLVQSGSSPILLLINAFKDYWLS